MKSVVPFVTKRNHGIAPSLTVMHGSTLKGLLTAGSGVIYLSQVLFSEGCRKVTPSPPSKSKSRELENVQEDVKYQAASQKGVCSMSGLA